MTKSFNQRGVSLIVAVFIIVILAFMGTMFVSMINTASFMSVNDLQSAQALYVAEGGLEFALQNGSFCTYATPATTLGGGTFTVVSRYIGTGGLAAATVTDNPLTAIATSINVTSTANYTIPGTVTIESEFIYCTGTSGGNRLTGCNRGWASSTAVQHNLGTAVTQCAVTSTGVVGSAQRAVTRAVYRSSGAMMVYAKGNADGTPYYRRWEGTAWGAEFAATAVPAAIEYTVLKCARTRNEAILGTISSNGDVRVQVWDGAAWGATTLLANIGTTNDNYRGLDIEYETNSDRAIVVYDDGTADPDYRIWDGVGWSAAGININVPTTGIARWIELARNPLGGSNEIAMILLDSNDAVYGMRWTGGGWDNMGAGAAWGITATSTTKAIHVAYEQLSGRALFVWGRNVNSSIGYRIWTGVNLLPAQNQNITSIGGNTANWMRLGADPYSNDIMLEIQDNGRDLITSLWNGGAWDATGTQHDNSTEDASRNADVVFETAPANAGRAWLLWGNGSRLSRRQWNGAAWGGITTTGDDTSLVQLMAHPVSGDVFSGIYESSTSATKDIWESHLTGGSAVWSAKFTVWGGNTVASPVMERLALAPERRNLLVPLDWNEIVP